MAGIPQVITEDRASGAQVIDGSLRFDDNNKQYLTQTIGNGTNGFTISCWMKPCQTGNRDEIFDTVASTGFYLYRHTDGSIRINNNSQALFTSNGLYRDTSSFYHIVFSYKSTSGYGTLWVNGKVDKSAYFTTQLYAGTAKISSEASNDPANYYLGQWYLIDGLALGPSYFGYTDPLTATWRPKKFRAEGTTVNDGTEWTTKMSNTTLIYSGSASNVYNGDSSWSSSNYASFNQGTLTLLTGVSIEVKNSLRIFGNWGYGDYIVINGVNYLNDGDGSNKWITPTGVTYPFTLTTLALDTTPLGYQNSLSAIEIDGVILTDSTTQNLDFGANGFYLPMDGNSPIGEDQAPSPNDGTVWSNNLTGTANGSGLITEMFDGNLSSGSWADSNGYVVTFPNGGVTASNNIKLYGGSGSANWYAVINGTKTVINAPGGSSPAWSATGVTGYVDLGSGTLTSIGTEGAGIAQNGEVSGVEIDGTILLDGKVGNSWKPVNFGGSTLPENPIVSGARPILNNLGGTVAKPGVFGSNVGATYKTTSLTNSTGKYYFAHDSGTAAPSFNFIRGATYVFDNTIGYSHTLRLSTTSNGTWGGGSVYTDGVETFGNFTVITVPHDAPNTLYYFCTVHTGMGGSINVTTDETKADKYASSLVLACPFAGDKEDVSNQINCTVSSKGSDNYGSEQRFKHDSFYSSSRFFDGSNDNINYSSSSSLGFPGAFTIEMYATPSTVTDGTPISSRGYYHQNGNWYLKYTTQNGGKFQFYSYSPGTSNGQTNNFTNTGTTDGNKIHHIVCQRDSSNLMSCMIDGVLIGQASNVTHNLDDGASTGLTVGRMAHSGSANNAHAWYAGYISDLRIYKGITKYDVSGKSVGDQIFVPASANPDILPDSPSGVAVKTQLTKITDSAVSVSRSGNEYIQAPASTDFRLDGQYCIEYFLNLSDYSNDSVYVRTFVLDGPTGDGGNTNIHLNVNPSTGKLLFWNGSGELISGTISVAGGWHHVCLTRDSSNVTRLFVDGVLSGSATITTDYTLNSNQNRPRLGALGDTGGTTGYYSNWRITKGSIPFDYQTASTEAGDRYFIPPTEPLTTTSQGATANDVKLIACQSDTSAGSATVSPNISGLNNGTVWSDYLITTQGASNRDFYTVNNYPASNLFDGDTSVHMFGGWIDDADDNSDIIFTPPSGITVSSKLEVYVGYYDKIKVNGTTYNTGGQGTNLAWVTVSDGSNFTGTLTELILENRTNANVVRASAIRIDDSTILVDPVSPVRNAAATNFNPFTTDINTVRGNGGGYCTLNPEDGFVSLKEGNLETVTSTGWQGIKGSLGMSTGKFYWESQNNQTAAAILGITDSEAGPFKDGAIFGSTGHGGGDINPAWCWAGANYYFNATSASSGGMANHLATDVVQYAFDADAGKLWFGRNGVWFGPSWDGNGDPASGANATVTNIDNTRTYLPCATLHNGGAKFNFGQKPFRFSPPDGFQPITTSAARPDTVIPDPDQYVKAVQYTGTGSDLTLDVGFKPDFSYFANRTGNGYIKYLFDSVRGATKALATSGSQGSNQETTLSDGLKSFNSNGVTIGNNGQMNENANSTWISWHWKAGGGKPSGGGFFKDDVEYADAAALNMSVGSLNSATFDKTQNWTGQITGTQNGSYPFANMFNGDGQATHAYPANGTRATFTPSPSFSNAKTVKVWYYAPTINADTFQLNGVNVGDQMTTTGGTLTKTFNVDGFTSWSWSKGVGGDDSGMLRIDVDGVQLVDSGVTTPDTPSDATTACSVGTKQGFSILKWTGGGADTTLSHGLTEAPQFMMVKHLANNSTNWIVYHHRLADATKYLRLNSTATQQTQAAAWDSQHPTSNVIHLGAEVEANHVGQPMVAYVWHDVPGLQKFGKWTNNDSIYGAYINLGFRPAIILLKDIDGGEDWYIIDSIRHPYNQPAPSNNASGAVNTLNPNTNHHESNSRGGHTNTTVDILSNGFKIRSTNTAAGEISFGTRNYVYAAWAEAPELNLYGAQSNAR